MNGREKGVHIVAAHFEYDRIVKPMLDKYPIEKVVILSSPSGNLCKAADCPRAKHLVEHFIQKIENYPIEVETVPVDFTDFKDILLKTSRAIDKANRRGLPVYMNLSSVPTLALLAMMNAASIKSKDTDIEMFFAAPESCIKSKIFGTLSSLEIKSGEEYDDELEKITKDFMDFGTAKGVREYITIPIFPIPHASNIDLRIMKLLKELNGVTSIKELLEKFNEKYDDKIKRSSLQYRLKKLKEKKYISTERDDRRLQIELSNQGDIYISSMENIYWE